MQRDVFRQMLPTVHLLIRLYLTIPVNSASPERTFSALNHVLTYTRSTMTESRLNNCLLLHVHKNLTDELDLILILVAKQFIHNDERKKFFGNFLKLVFLLYFPFHNV